MRRLVMFGSAALLLVGLTGGVGAAEKVYDVSVAAIPGPVSDGGESGRIFELWDFEVGEGFVPGYIDSQVGWAAFPASLVEAHIDTANPFAGAQHLRISQDPAVATATNIGAFSPEVTDTVVDPSFVTVFVSIGATGGADYDVVPQAPSQSFLTARVKFSYVGDIYVLDDTGGGLAFVDTGVDWVPGAYMEVGIFVDPGANTITYSYGGTQIYTSVAGVFAGTVIEQVVLLSDNFNAGESCDFDELVIERGAVPVELQSFNVD